MRYLDLIRNRPELKLKSAELTSEQWIESWHNLARITDRITKDDPRFLSVCEALEDCDHAFEQDNWTVFQQAAESVKRLVEENEIGG